MPIKPLDLTALQGEADRAATEEAGKLAGAAARTVKLSREGTSLMASIDGRPPERIADIRRSGGAERADERWIEALRPMLAPAPVAAAPAAEMEKLLAEANARVAAVEAAVFAPLLRRVVDAKVAAYGNKSYVADEVSFALAPAEALVALARNIASQTTPADGGPTATPLLFVEFFRDEPTEKHYGLGWRVDSQGARPAALNGAPMVWRIDDPASMSGDDLLPIVARQEAADEGSWGLVVGLGGGELATKRWASVSFGDERAIRDVGWACNDAFDLAQNAAAAPQTPRFRSLAELFQPVAQVHCGNVIATHRRVGLWCVPSLGGGYKRGGSVRWDLTLAGTQWRGSRITVDGRQAPVIAFARSAGLSVTLEASEFPYYFEWKVRSGGSQLDGAWAVCPAVYVD